MAEELFASGRKRKRSTKKKATKKPTVGAGVIADVADLLGLGKTAVKNMLKHAKAPRKKATKKRATKKRATKKRATKKRATKKRATRKAVGGRRPQVSRDLKSVKSNLQKALKSLERI